MTNWCKNSCRNTKRAGPVTLGLLAALLLAAAQEPLEQRYQRAVRLFNNAQMEDACELFQQIEKEKPGYQETHTYLNPACLSAKQAYTLEEKLFTEGVQLFNQKRLDEAKQKFEQASKIPLRNPKYRTQSERYLKEIGNLLGEEGLYQEAVRLFNEGKDADASAKFTQIERSGGAKAADARNYLQQLKERREDSTWNEAVGLFTKGDYSGARRIFGEVIQTKGKHAVEAQNYLNRISATESDQQLFEEAVHAFDQKRYSDASARFNQLIQKGSARAAEARTYLQRIDEAQKQEAALRALVAKKVEAGQDPKQVARQFVTDAEAAMASRHYATALELLKAAESLQPANREVRSLVSQAQELAAAEPLRQGLEAYFQGQFVDAQRHLSEYVGNHGHKLALAYFFRGAVHSSLYFLSGERDMREKELALVDFRASQKDAPQFQPPKKYVSPKILSLYSAAVKGAH